MNKKTNQQLEEEATKGRISYRKRIIQENEARQELESYLSNDNEVAEFLWFQRDLFEQENNNRELDDSTEI